MTPLESWLTVLCVVLPVAIGAGLAVRLWFNNGKSRNDRTSEIIRHNVRCYLARRYQQSMTVEQLMFNASRTPAL